ncbi:hypothetical protein CZ814_00975 [Photobacterium toruni]|uniref:Uncharacterized protein n=1 Tax=Photobacterium toruni TaxID=1935446 RepID=A0A1T4Q9N7_9GAMM|nr:hypothetical protein CZ814_00975 [Photobacterium toruni]
MNNQLEMSSICVAYALILQYQLDVNIAIYFMF